MLRELDVDGVFEPEELARMQRLFDQICFDHGLAQDSPDCESLAHWLMSIYKSGVRDEALLKAAAKRRFRGKR